MRCCPWPCPEAGRTVPRPRTRRLTSLPKRGADDATVLVDGQHNYPARDCSQLETGCSPIWAPQPTALMGWAFVKTSASGADADLEILAPQPFLLQEALDLERLRRARDEVAQAVAHRGRDAGTNLLGARAGVARRRAPSMTRSSMDRAKVTPQAP